LETTSVPRSSSSDSNNNAQFDKGIWGTIIVVMFLFIGAGFYVKHKRGQQRAGGYDLNPPVMVGLGVGGVEGAAAQAKQARRDQYAIDSPPISPTPQTGPHVQETDVDAQRTFASRTLLLSSRVSERKELMEFGTTAEAAARQAAGDRAGAYGAYEDEDGDQGGYLEVGGALNAAANSAQFSWKLGGHEAPAVNSNGVLVPLARPNKPSVEWTPEHYANPEDDVEV
jgi:hypothetical protein